MKQTNNQKNDEILEKQRIDTHSSLQINRNMMTGNFHFHDEALNAANLTCT